MSRRKKGVLAAAIVLVAAIAIPSVLLHYALTVFLGPEGQYFDSAGVRIHYTDEGQGTPIVLVHGYGNPANQQWRTTGIIDSLAENYRVIALDNRGHGRSDKPHDPKQYGLNMVEDLMRLLDHLGIEKAHVLGYSMGGFIILKLITRHPERVLSAAACAAGWERDSPQNRDFAEAVAKAVAQGSFGPLRKRLGLAERPLTFLQRFEVYLAMTRFNDPLALAAVARASQELTLTEDDLKANTVPTLTMIGSEDGLLPDAQALHAHMAHHELVVIEGKNHVNADASDEFLARLEAFLAAHTPARRAPAGWLHSPPQ